MNDLASFAAHRESDIVVGALSGEIDLSNATELEREIAEAVPNSMRGLVLDLSALTYLDSSGIRLVLSIAGSLRWRGQDLVLAVPDGSRCKRVLSMAGIDGSVKLEPSADAARAWFAAERGTP
jgi:anti-anti-sigma factor